MDSFSVVWHQEKYQHCPTLVAIIYIPYLFHKKNGAKVTFITTCHTKARNEPSPNSTNPAVGSA